MNLSKITLAVATLLGVSSSFSAFAIDLYVDTRTKQIYAEPGPHRKPLGSFEKKEEQVEKSVSDAPKNVDAELTAIKEELALKENAIKALEEHAKEASEFQVKLDDGIEFKSHDGNFKAGINGRLQVDSQSNVNQALDSNYLPGTGATAPATLNDGATLRRARLGVEGTFFKNTDYKFEYDFARGNGLNAGGITDSYIRYNFPNHFL